MSSKGTTLHSKWRLGSRPTVVDSPTYSDGDASHRPKNPNCNRTYGEAYDSYLGKIATLWVKEQMERNEGGRYKSGVSDSLRSSTFCPIILAVSLKVDFLFEETISYFSISFMFCRDLVSLLAVVFIDLSIGMYCEVYCPIQFDLTGSIHVIIPHVDVFITSTHVMFYRIFLVSFPTREPRLSERWDYLIYC